MVETSAKFAAIPDNQGRANAGSAALMDIIRSAKQDTMTFLGASEGQVFVGESGTELLFRLIRTAIMGRKGAVIGSTVEHPASRSAAQHWAEHAGVDYISVAHDTANGIVTPQAYAASMRPDVSVATVLHTSPVTGMTNDVAGIVREIRAVVPDAIVVVDGIQHASHGGIDVTALDVDGYVISPYKVFSRHGYGVAWVGPRLNALPLEALRDGPEGHWELGTRDTGAYATMSDVVGYFDWLGGQVSDASEMRGRIEAAGRAIHLHEAALCRAMLYGTGNLPGLSELPGVQIIGGVANAAREGLVSFAIAGRRASEIVEALNVEGIRTHTRKADHYSGNILTPLGLDEAVRVSMCHYNSVEEVSRFLAVMKAMS